MKKRLLALALSLVLMTSLLPLTAAASDRYVFKSWVMTGGEVKKAQGNEAYYVSIDNITFSYHDKTSNKDTTIDENTGGGSTLAITTDRAGNQPINTPPEEGITYYVEYYRLYDEIDENVKPRPDSSFSPKLIIPGYETEFIRFYHFPNNPYDQLSLYFSLTKKHEHNWQFTQTDSTLTATCQNQSCNKEVSASLVADSVTLPDSPFNAQVILKGMNAQEIKEEFGYTISDIRYKFKAPGDSDFAPITPADGAREGTYQAAVTLTPLYPQASYALNDDGTNQGLVMEPDGSIILYTQYTAVNPQTTAQTGDNRPIEIMMASALVFSALAAAAFIVDNKRKYSR